MVRPRDEHWWEHVTELEKGKKWKCKYCNYESKSGATRIKEHLTGKVDKSGKHNIKRCPKYHPGIDNNMASTSSIPPQAAINTTYSTHDDQVIEGAMELIETNTSNLVNHQNNSEVMNSSAVAGVDGNGGNRSVCESEIDQLNQLVLDLDCEKNHIEKQVQCLESCGKKRKPEVDVWLEELQELKESVSDMMSNLNDTHAILYLILDLEQHKKRKPLTLLTEYVGRKLDRNIYKVLKLLDDDKVFVIGIHGMGGVGKTLLATMVENELKRKTTFKNV